MTIENDYQRFKIFWDKVAHIYRASGGETDSMMYFQSLKDYPFEVVTSAIMECMKVSEFIPKPNQIIEQLHGGSYADRARMVWVAVREAIMKHHASSSVFCDDPAVMWTIKALGGWHYVCYMDSEKAEKNFTEYYETALRQRITKDEAPAYLKGDDEIRNSCIGQWDKSQIKRIELPDRINKGIVMLSTPSQNAPLLK